MVRRLKVKVTDIPTKINTVYKMNLWTNRVDTVKSTRHQKQQQQGQKI